MKDEETEPKTIPVSLSARALEAALAEGCETVRKSLALAHSIDPREDDIGQDKAFDRALKFLQASARAGFALAKVKSEFTAKINVTRRTLPPGPDPELERARIAGDKEYWDRWTRLFHAETAVTEEGEELPPRKPEVRMHPPPETHNILCGHGIVVAASRRCDPARVHGGIRSTPPQPSWPPSWRPPMITHAPGMIMVVRSISGRVRGPGHDG